MSTLSTSKAVRFGLIFVNVPVLILMLCPLYIFGEAVSRGVIPSEYNWVGLLVFVGGFLVAWLWWSVTVPIWRLWAYRRVNDLSLLKTNAVRAGLIWPDGSWLSRTEIKSQAHALLEKEFEHRANENKET